ncbi:MAG: cytochrome c [Candidatus Aminicenantes bacterium]|nr:cytochrome c [Candidatus Aminicenantes bacterium]
MNSIRFRKIDIFVFGLIFFFAAVLPGCDQSGKKEAGVPGRNLASSPVMEVQKPHLVSDMILGRKVFEAKNCNQCHSIFERERKIGPKLKSSRFYGSFLDIFSLLWNHAPAMAVQMRREVLDRPTFSTTELNELISFLYMLPYLGDSGDARRGVALLESKSCFKCHSLGRKGKRDGTPLDSLAVYQSPVVLLQRMWNHGPEMIGRMATTGTSIPSFSGNEMLDIFAALTEEARDQSKKVFLGVGQAENGEKLFTAKGCVKCHSIFGEGGKQAPDLGKTVFQSNVTKLTTQIWNHVGRMRQLYNQEKLQWPNFTETEMNDMIVFLYSLNYLDKPGDAAKGEKIFAQKKCIGCHFKTKEDKEKLLGAMKAIHATQFGAELWNHTSAMEAAMVTQGVPWPEMSGAQLRDVLAFLQKP